MRGVLVGWLAVASLVVGCSVGEVRTEPVRPPPSTGRALIGEVIDSGPALLPDPAAVVAAAGAPSDWRVGPERAVLLYHVARAERRDVGARLAVVLVDREGDALGRWALRRPGWRWLQWWPAGGGFVATTVYGTGRLLVRPGGVTALSQERGSRPFRQGDLRFGHGWLLDRSSASVTREQLPRQQCGGGAAVDLRGRTWCLDEEKAVVSWTDDHETWTSHTLSTSHREWCDGGTTGADVQVLGDQVVVGLYRADISPDRGESWYDVDLPYEMVGAHRGAGGSFPNCTTVRPLSDGRLVLSYFVDAVATDAGNSSFTLVDQPSGYRGLGHVEGVFRAIHRTTRQHLVSYDGGSTWVPLRVPELLGALFDDQRG